jgi:hypothetical protein
MFHFPSNGYAEWRSRIGLAAILRDEGEAPPERLLQVIWLHQRLRRDQLRTADGRGVRVLHPGFWNREAGPDFRGVVLQFEGEEPSSGDIEVDLHSSGWRTHRHDINPDFKKVILHVVWEADRSVNLPTLALKPVLDSPLAELALWIGSEAAQVYPAELLGHCCSPLQTLTPERLADLLRQAAFIRLQAKAAHLQAHAREAGWEQALWGGLFRALGYKQNVWPMQRLSELQTRLCPNGTKLTPLELQARILGVGGLLPAELPGIQFTDAYVRRLWDLWWRERENLADCLLPRSLWRFSGLRPANHPQRRLALAAHWLATSDLPQRLERWCASRVEESAMPSALLDVLQGGTDDFWSRHWTLRSRAMSEPKPLLGASRVADLAINVILPWAWARAVEEKKVGLRQEMERRYYAWPPAQDNAVLRLVRQRLLGGTSLRSVRKAAAQQGLLQIVKDFCEQSNAACAGCRFPGLVRQWAS